MKCEYDKLCRICGNYDTQLMPIFREDGLEHDLSEKIKKHFYSIQVSESDELPLQMCYQCVSVLISWNDLFELCENVNQKLNFELNKDETNINYKKEDGTPLSALLTNNNSNTCSENNELEIKINGNNEKEDSTSSTLFVYSTNDTCNRNDKNGKIDSEPNYRTDDNLNNEIITNGCDSNLMEEGYEFTTNVNETSKPRRRQKRKKCTVHCVCYICGKIFIGPDTLKIHIRTVHSEDRPYSCIECSFKFKRRDHLLSHKKMVHAVKKSKQNDEATIKEIKCVHCAQIFPSRHDRKMHIEKVHGEMKAYKCEECNIVFAKYSTYYHHRTKRNHSIKNFLKYCEHCGLEFENEIFYIRHTWKHEENVNCDLCSVTFESRDSFKEHIDAAHSEKRDLQCDACGKKFSRKHSLQNHLLSHSDEKPFQCQYCSWKFHKKGHLTAHTYRHTGERPYVCNICNKGFKQKGDMRKHKIGHIKANLKKSTQL